MFEGGLADAVIDDVDAPAPGRFAHLCHPVFVARVEGVGGAVGLGARDFFIRAGERDDFCAERAAPLDQQRADAAGCGMDQDGVALLYLKGLAQQEMRGGGL